ncbi:hypothetical protein ACC691_37570 [Rhizobium johnstonii]
MPDNTPKLPLKGDDDKPPISNARIAIWVIVGAIALYLIGSGVWGILTH